MKYYLVRDAPDKQRVADMFGQLNERMHAITAYLSNKEQYHAYITKLAKRLDYVSISENINDLSYTSYSVNKGEKLVFCVRSREEIPLRERLYDINLLMYVTLHEMAHIACPEYGHTELFKQIFHYLTINAIQMGLYTSIDFRSIPTEYCGMMITDSIV
jgi:hypothetical protein